MLERPGLDHGESRESGDPSSTESATGITAAVLTRNVAADIEACLTALAWTDSIVVVDDFSTDNTRAVCERSGARVYERRLESFAAQRNFALAHVQTPWVLFIDSDEHVSPALAAEIRAAVEDETVAGYWIPRKNLFGERWVKHAGWGPDYQLRLFRVAKGRYDPSRFAHETVLLDGPEKHLTELLTHYNYASVGQFLRQAATLCATGGAAPLARRAAGPLAQLRAATPARVSPPLLFVAGLRRWLAGI